jgi:PIN domain nuclease of toxin-antitoxin system
MRRPILLDTCAAIWLANNEDIDEAAEAALAEAEQDVGGIVVSPISAWEIGQLASRGRLALAMEPAAWFRTVLDSGVVLAPMPPEVLVASSFLPGGALRDPADRILAATARAFSFRLMTRDRPLLEFGEAGHLQAIAC